MLGVMVDASYVVLDAVDGRIVPGSDVSSNRINPDDVWSFLILLPEITSVLNVEKSICQIPFVRIVNETDVPSSNVPISSVSAYPVGSVDAAMVCTCACV